MNDDRTSAAASFGHDVEERSCVTRQGQRVEFLLGSTCLGLCDVDFPDHRAKPHDMTMMSRERGISFVSLRWGFWRCHFFG